MMTHQWNRNTVTRTLLLFCAFLVLSSCKTTDLKMFDEIDLGQLTTTTFDKLSDLSDKTDEKETEFGYEVSQVLLEDSEILNNDEVQLYVNQVGQWLVQNSERPELKWHFVVLNDNNFNAFAAPGGFVFITSGTLQRLHNEAELAGILAHEIAHILKRHYLNALQKQTSLDLASDVSILAYQLSNNRKGRSSDKTQENAELADQISSGVDTLYANGLARGDEEEADRMAVILMARAGYDPYAYITVLQKIASEKPGASAWLRFMKRHPPAVDRLVELEPVMDEVFTDTFDYETVQPRYQQLRVFHR